MRFFVYGNAVNKYCGLFDFSSELQKRPRLRRMIYPVTDHEIIDNVELCSLRYIVCKIY